MNYRYPDKILDNIIEKDEMHSVYAIKFAVMQEQITKLQIENKRLKVKIKKIIDALNCLGTDEKRVRTIKVILHRELKNELNK